LAVEKYWIPLGQILRLTEYRKENLGRNRCSGIDYFQSEIIGAFPKTSWTRSRIENAGLAVKKTQVYGLRMDLPGCDETQGNDKKETIEYS